MSYIMGALLILVSFIYAIEAAVRIYILCYGRMDKFHHKLQVLLFLYRSSAHYDVNQPQAVKQQQRQERHRLRKVERKEKKQLKRLKRRLKKAAKNEKARFVSRFCKENWQKVIFSR